MTPVLCHGRQERRSLVYPSKIFESSIKAHLALGKSSELPALTSDSVRTLLSRLGRFACLIRTKNVLKTKKVALK